MILFDNDLKSCPLRDVPKGAVIMKKGYDELNALDRQLFIKTWYDRRRKAFRCERIGDNYKSILFIKASKEVFYYLPV